MRGMLTHTVRSGFVLLTLVTLVTGVVFFAGTTASFAEDKAVKKELRPWIGVMIQPLSDELKKKTGAKVAGGIYVVHADVDGPAYKAGMRHGDVIINAGAKSPSTVEEFIAFIQSQKPGKTITFVVIRDGKNKVIKIRPEEREYPFNPPRAKPDCRETLKVLSEEGDKPEKK